MYIMCQWSINSNRQGQQPGLPQWVAHLESWTVLQERPGSTLANMTGTGAKNLRIRHISKSKNWLMIHFCASDS